MPFKSKQQMKACFASDGFGGKVDCREFAKETDYKSLPNKKNMHNYRGKRLKTHKKNYQTGGTSMMFSSLITPKNRNAVYETQQDVDAANAMAQRLALKNSHIDPTNVMVASKPGDPMVPFVNENGMDITGAMDLFGTKPLATKIPSDITAADIQSGQGLYWYNDPRTGDIIDVDPSVVNLPRFRQQPAAVPANNNMPNALSMRMKGGRLRMQIGGQIPRQQDYPDYQSWIQAVDEWTATQNQSQMLPRQQTQNLLHQASFSEPTPDALSIPGNSVQDGMARGIIEPQRNSSVNQQRPNNNPYQTLQNVGIGMQAARTGLGWLAGAVERGRQNKFDMTQQTALGQMNPMQASDFQPNPFNLYAKYGGNLKTIMKDFNKWSNDAGPMDMTEGKGNPELKKGGYEIDRMLIVRKLLPQLLKFGTLGTSKYRNYKKGGIN